MFYQAPLLRILADATATSPLSDTAARQQSLQLAYRNVALAPPPREWQQVHLFLPEFFDRSPSEKTSIKAPISQSRLRVCQTDKCDCTHMLAYLTCLSDYGFAILMPEDLSVFLSTGGLIFAEMGNSRRENWRYCDQLDLALCRKWSTP